MQLGNFNQIWVVDFEFRVAPGERPDPVCLVALELRSGRKLRIWQDALKGAACPYCTGIDSVVIAYYASAEMGCHLALGWPLPANVIDLYAEFRVETNGRSLPFSNGLLGALEYYNHRGIDALEKDAMRALILRGGLYTEQEREDILVYCESDVAATVTLCRTMSPILNTKYRLSHALLRGRYTKAVARMEDAGVPIDSEMLENLRSNWLSIKDELIRRVDDQYGVYDGRTFKIDRFAQYLARHGIPWATLPTGRLALDDDTFKEQCKTHPQLRPLKELRQALAQLKLSELQVGHDGRNRALLSMFRSKTGRNQPSNSKFVFGLSAWLRGLIRPTPGNGLAYVDWCQQEFGIAAALSGDLQMQDAYSSGDPYLAFAKQASAVPLDATKTTHAREREQFKACVLAVQYGMREESLARRILQPTAYARELLRIHRRTYARFWAWSEGVLNFAQTTGRLWTVFGWNLHVGPSTNARSLANFPMQANGAEMLRLACCLASERGIKIVAPVHDALLIEAPLDELNAKASEMQDLMRQASAIVLGGFELRTDIKFIRAPDRYDDERGITMWGIVQDLMSELRPPELTT
jgi:DNA polymerase-1